MQQEIQVIETTPRRGQVRGRPGWLVAALVIAAASVVTAGLIAVAGLHGPAASAAVISREPAAPASVLTGSPAAISSATARLLLAAAPGAVVADASSRADVTRAAAIAGHAHAPLLLLTPGRHVAAQLSALRPALSALAPRAVLPVGISTGTLAADLPGVTVVGTASALPAAHPAAPQRHVAVLIHQSRTPAGAALAMAATATARTAGAIVITLPGYDPRADPAAIRQLSAAHPSRVIGVGGGFQSARLLGRRVAVAETGVQLPGGGQVLFPMRRIVALYGVPGVPVLGALGQQGLHASVARAKRVAAQYARLSKVAVVPAFEIIAAVATGSPGPDRTYSYAASVGDLRPWVDAATKAGMYVTLDLQPGRANLLTEAKMYAPLLRLPNVGLALDPEWKLGPNQLPMRQIGSVGIGEVNSVVTWLARLTAQYHLPQKLLELHEFRLSMIQDISKLDTRQDDLAIVINMDGQGAPTTKRATWAAVVANAPHGVFFGWKDFYRKDTPMLDPAQTLNNHPEPVLISYQ